MQPNPRYESEPQAELVDIYARFQQHYGRFILDAVAIVLIAIAVILFLALFGFTNGDLPTPIAYTLWRWTGLGSLALPTTILLAGFSIFRRRNYPGEQLRWGRIIAIELFYFFSLVLLSIIGGTSIERAEGGWDGGYIGWAIAYLLGRLIGDLWRNIIITLGVLIFGAIGFGLMIKIENFLWKMAGDEPLPPPDDFQAIPAPGSAAQAEQTALPPEPVTQTAPPPRKPAIQLPPQFRKNFKVDEQKDEKPAEPKPRGTNLPPLNLLFGDQNIRPDERHINQTAGLIEKTLSEFGIPAKVSGFRIGPTVTQFAVQPGFIKKPGTNEEDPQQMKVRVAQIAALQKDLALALSAERLRIEAPVPGRSYVGIEVPNARTALVRLRPVLESDTFHKTTAPLAVALGRDVSGQPVIADLARMPHLLVAGQTGSGKSVAIAALAACLAMNNAPEEMRMVMIDAKMVELLRFNGLPHLYGKVETDVQRILGVLRWVVLEMEHRYRLLEGSKVRDLETYNRKVTSRKDGAGLALPRIVVFIDELADLMMSAPDQTEHNLVRLAQMARATGIHLVVATQRPSTDVVTGLIKANFPARLAFAVASGIDSRVILDTPGAESLLGRGDLLFLNPEVGSPIRAQGVLITDQEIERIIAFWQKMSPASNANPPWESLLNEPGEDSDDALVNQAIEIVRQGGRASASLLQRRLKIGYPRAARLLDQLEEMGVVGPSLGGGRDREVIRAEDGDEDE